MIRTDHWNAIRVNPVTQHVHGAPNGWASMMTTHWGPLAAHAFPACAPNHTCSVSGNSDKKPRWRENHKQWVSLLLLLIFFFVYSRIIFLLDIYAICTMNMKYYVCAHSKTFWEYTYMHDTLPCVMFEVFELLICPAYIFFRGSDGS